MQEEILLPPLPDSEETGLPDLSDARFYTQYPDFFLSIYTGFVFAQILLLSIKSNFPPKTEDLCSARYLKINIFS